jgi:hypothetical protein
MRIYPNRSEADNFRQKLEETPEQRIARKLATAAAFASVFGFVIKIVFF